MSNTHFIEPSLINMFLIISPYIFGLIVFHQTAEAGKSIGTFIISVPIAYSLIYYLNNIPFNFA
jgi:hypothetical protein